MLRSTLPVKVIVLADITYFMIMMGIVMAMMNDDDDDSIVLCVLIFWTLNYYCEYFFVSCRLTTAEKERV